MMISKSKTLCEGTRFELGLTGLDTLDFITSSLVRPLWPVSGKTPYLMDLSLSNIPFTGQSAAYVWLSIETSRGLFV